MQETQVQSLGWEDKGMATHSSVLAQEIHGQKSLAGYSPWDHQKRPCGTFSSTKDLPHFLFFLFVEIRL